MESDERAAAIVDAHPVLYGCEHYPLSWRSPGKVEDDELLHFLITDPQAIDQRSGKLLPDAVAQLHKKGLSVLREGAFDLEFVETFIEMKRGSDRTGKPRFLSAVSTFATASVRYDGGDRCVGVFASGLPGRWRHADLLASPKSALSRKRLRKRLLDILEAGREDIRTFRNGRLAHLERPAGNVP